MLTGSRRAALVSALVWLAAACGSSETGSSARAPSSGGASGAAGAAQAPSSGGASGAAGTAQAPDPLAVDRERLLESYLAFLKTEPAKRQTNGLSGGELASACELWQALDPSARATFLTLTARMQGSRLGADGSSMLSHVTRLYRVVGGDGATAKSPGSCGGGENNRMLMSMDAALHDALLAAAAHRGAVQPSGARDLSDVVAASFWRESRDLGGAHAPFDATNETEGGAPRGQTQYFSALTSSAAGAPLGRTDLESLIDPLALELDHDYDCFHSSNPLCSYTLYGPACLPKATQLGTAIYEASYGSFDAGFSPCP